MTCTILGLGTALPNERMSQDEVLSMSTDVICETPRQARLMRMLFNKSGVEQRHSVIPWRLGYEWKQQDATNSGRGPLTGDRMALYAERSVPLALSASKDALHNARTLPKQITHLVTVSCTGFDAPGVDVSVIRSLGLPQTTQRIHVGFMGCHGAINGMRAAQGLIAQDPHARVLLCAVELCSLHYRMTWDDEGIIGNALFADGAAAMVLGGAETGSDALWNLQATGSCLIPDSADEMSWRVGNHGFDMRLTSGVPAAIEAALRPWMSAWLDSQNSSIDGVHSWAVHPGGPRILDATEKALELPEDALAISRGVLREFGNMSSPTVLFILDRMREKDGDPTVVLGFGPGLVAEAVLLRKPE